MFKKLGRKNHLMAYILNQNEHEIIDFILIYI